MRTMVTFLNVAAQSGSAAGADVMEGFLLWWRQGVPPLIQEFLPVLSDDIGHFEPTFPHRRLRLSLSGVQVSRMARSSNGLWVVCTLLVET